MKSSAQISKQDINLGANKEAGAGSTGAGNKAELYGETNDNFVNVIHKKLRNKKKKLDRVLEKELQV